MQALKGTQQKKTNFKSVSPNSFLMYVYIYVYIAHHYVLYSTNLHDSGINKVTGLYS